MKPEDITPEQGLELLDEIYEGLRRMAALGPEFMEGIDKVMEHSRNLCQEAIDKGEPLDPTLAQSIVEQIESQRAIKDFAKPQVKKIGRNDPCVCGSGNKFKKCCVSQLDNRGRPLNGTVVRRNDVETHHFFLVSKETGEAHRNPMGQILVWENRGPALAHSESLEGDWIVGGMGDDKWILFQQMEQFVVVANDG